MASIYQLLVAKGQAHQAAELRRRAQLAPQPKPTPLQGHKLRRAA